MLTERLEMEVFQELHVQHPNNELKLNLVYTCLFTTKIVLGIARTLGLGV